MPADAELGPEGVLADEVDIGVEAAVAAAGEGEVGVLDEQPAISGNAVTSVSAAIRPNIIPPRSMLTRNVELRESAEYGI